MAAADPFTCFADVTQALRDPPAPDALARERAEAREAVLTKPAGALGRLETLAVWFAGWRPVTAAPDIQALVFAGNHGVCARGVSPYPAEVTAQMVANFQAGGAAINQLCRLHGARLQVVPLALERPTADFTEAPAMSEAECCEAIQAGWSAVDAAADCLILGEMGIGNTTSAAAVSAALLGGTGQDWVGPGAGAAGPMLARKVEAVSLGLARHAGEIASDGPLEALRRLGGREIAACFGALARARVERLPVLLDGFVVGAAAVVLRALDADLLAHCQAAHRSAEPGHDRQLRALALEPLLDLGMRLGEGSGAAAALGVLRAALACHAGMASFADAGVSTRDDV